MLKKLKEKIRNTTTPTDFWLSNKSFNKLLDESESVQLIGKRVFKLKFGNGDMVAVELLLDAFVCTNSEECCVRVMRLNYEYKADSNVIEVMMTTHCEVL